MKLRRGVLTALALCNRLKGEKSARKKLRQRSEAVLEMFAALSHSSTRAAAFLSGYRPRGSQLLTGAPATRRVCSRNNADTTESVLQHTVNNPGDPGSSHPHPPAGENDSEDKPILTPPQLAVMSWRPPWGARLCGDTCLHQRPAAWGSWASRSCLIPPLWLLSFDFIFTLLFLWWGITTKK